MYFFFISFCFFFQAEDGIRDRDVTGVQTCALPIFAHGLFLFPLRGNVPFLVSTPHNTGRRGLLPSRFVAPIARAASQGKRFPMRKAPPCHTIAIPPFTCSVAPVTYPASAEAR